MSIALPPAPFPRIFMVDADWVGGNPDTRTIANAIYLDGSIADPVPRSNVLSISGEHSYSFFPPRPVVVPGDGLAHVIALYVWDLGGSGSIAFNQRWITARCVAP